MKQGLKKPEDLKKSRVRLSRLLSRKPQRFFNKIIWIDAAKIWVHIDESG